MHFMLSPWYSCDPDGSGGVEKADRKDAEEAMWGGLGDQFHTRAGDRRRQKTRIR